MTKEENELLTQTGPGTPCGELMRRYWQPAALSEELPPGAAPLPLKMFSEELVLFRDGQGRPGLLGLHCSHRGADLSYGRLENGGLRCIYHGWLYDINGKVIDTPGEADAGASFRDSICHKAYPCQERGGVIFAYMGPGKPPLLPNYGYLTVPEDHTFVTKIYQECNYLQANEGNIDLVHLSFLHFNKYKDTGGPSVGPVEFSGRGGAPGLETTEADLADFGLRICKIRKVGSDKKYLRMGNFVMPNLSAPPGQFNGKEGYLINWHVPIDDTHHWKYILIFNRERPLDREEQRTSRIELGEGYRPLRNKSNRYLQDRDSMKSETYTGIGLIFQVQDVCVTEGAGAVQDRTQEHLVTSSDAAIVVARKLMLKGIQDVQEGRDPQHVIRDPAANNLSHLFAYSVLVPSDTNWKEYCNQLLAELRG
ncbi:MAG TPA: Rieske 2Fe-2S domain-containing protein [Candidatus Binatia bacterium]